MSWAFTVPNPMSATAAPAHSNFFMRHPLLAALPEAVSGFPPREPWGDNVARRRVNDHSRLEPGNRAGGGLPPRVWPPQVPQVNPQVGLGIADFRFVIDD